MSKDEWEERKGKSFTEFPYEIVTIAPEKSRITLPLVFTQQLKKQSRFVSVHLLEDDKGKKFVVIKPLDVKI